MKPLPATDLRSNTLTLAVWNTALPRVGCFMTNFLPQESYDPSFRGQQLETVYFDTLAQDLRKARLKKEKYCTIRLRCYPGDVYALSLKTENGKYRAAIDPRLAEDRIAHGIQTPGEMGFVPVDLLARVLDLIDDKPLYPVARVCFTRFAVEDATDRVTLDVDIRSNTGKVFPANILEHKTVATPARAPHELLNLGFPPIKLSKFLWSTTYGVR